MPILPLNNTTVKLITSTQIITSVFSVVKELVENSLDAGAKNIEISLTDNGSSLIEVRDDGCGILTVDIPNMAMPHHTSKISDFSDLDSLTTYGFRGEALNAICRVAEVVVTTKTIQDETAKSYTLDNDGNIASTELSHRFIGTSVRVKKLFHNLPVRRQIVTNQRKSKQDIKKIENLLKSLSICQPIVRMNFRVNNNLVFLKPSCTNIKEAFSHIMGSKVVANLEWIHNEDSEVKLQLMIPKQNLIDPQPIYEPNEQYVMINNRPVKYKQFEKIIDERVSDHFGGKVPPKKHPTYLLCVTVAPNEVDVNFEPNKTSVLLKNQDTILKKLAKILVDYYNLCDENIGPDMSVSNTSIETSPEYHDFTQNLATAVEVPPCKKPRLNNKQKTREFSLDLNTDSEGKRKGAEKRSLNNSSGLDNNSSSVKAKSDADRIQSEEIERADRDTMDRILKAFPGPVLSDSDSESFADTDPNKKGNETPVIIGHAVRSDVAEKEIVQYAQKKIADNSESFASISPNANMFCEIQMNNIENETKTNADTDYCEPLSQLPVVDLGEDFDIAAILERPPANRVVKSEETSCSLKNSENKNDHEDNGPEKNSSRANSSLEIWSRGQIPGLKGSTDVTTYNNQENNSKSSTEKQNKADSNTHSIYHTGFSKFSYEIRSQVLEENPGAALPVIGKILANRWKELSPEERGYYRDLAMEEKKNAEAEKKKLKTKQLSQQEADKNKARLIQMLESMKKTRNNKKFSLNDRTTVPWEVNVQSITKSFFSKPTVQEDRIIGRLTDDIWTLKSAEKICVINSNEVLETIDPIELEGEEKTAEKTATILQSWLKKDDANRRSVTMHTIYNIDSSPIVN